MKTSQTVIKALVLAGILGSLTLATVATAQESATQPAVTTSKTDYVSIPMPMFKMLTSQDKNREKPQSPKFFIYGSDGQLTPASTNLSDVMQKKNNSCQRNVNSENMCPEKPQTPSGKWANEDSTQPGKIAQGRGFPKNNEFVLMTPEEFNSLVQKKTESMNSRAAERSKKLMEEVNTSENAIDAKIDGKDAKVFFLPMPKMQPRGMPNQ